MSNNGTSRMIFLIAFATLQPVVQPDAAGAETGLAWIRLSEDGTQFVSAESGDRFIVWGFNYDHDDAGRLLEDYWVEHWPAI